MTIEITRPEIEALIQQRLHSGAFESVEDVLIDALGMQSEREAWLNSTGAKAYRGINCARVLKPIRRRGSRIAPVSEAIHCRAGSRR